MMIQLSTINWWLGWMRLMLIVVVDDELNIHRNPTRLQLIRARSAARLNVKQ